MKAVGMKAVGMKAVGMKAVGMKAVGFIPTAPAKAHSQNKLDMLY